MTAKVSAAVRDVLAERKRQITVEGWTPGHDDIEHEERELARAAKSYLDHYVARQWVVDGSLSGTIDYQSQEAPESWPWHKLHWKPKDPRRDLVRTVALLIAEIERIDRLKASR